MPEITIQAGAKMFIPDHGDIKRATQEAIEADRELQRARGIKPMHLPQTLSGAVKSSAITLGVGSGQVLGPEQGYAWSISALIVTGLTAGTSPDIVNLYLNDRFSGPVWWQFNGNNFGYTWGKLQRFLYPGETLSMQNSGNLAATGTITLSGDIIEVPAEQLWKLV